MSVEQDETENADGDDDGGLNEEIFEAEKVLSICYGDPKDIKKTGLCLSGCEEKIKLFVVQCFHSKILPLPGDVDVICGGPSCRGIRGFNRFRNTDEPLEDEKNKQLVVYMDIVEYLKPRFALMEML